MNFPSEIITAAGALIVAWVGHKLGYYRATNERIWDLRREAYSVILLELAKAEKIFDSADQYIQEDEDRYNESDIAQLHGHKIGEHLSAARDRYSSAYLILSDPFVELFEKFESEIPYDDNDSEHDPKPTFSEVLRKHRKILLAHARQEALSPHGRLSWWPFSWPKRAS